MTESWTTQFARWVFNFFPAFRGTGGKVTYISHDWKEIHLKLPLSWRTRNYVGTIFGGSLYASADPFYMLMLIKILGPDYIVWDKAAHILFKKPGRSTLYAKFLITSEEIEEIKRLAEANPSIERLYRTDLADIDGETCASIEKTIYIRKKSP